MNINKQKMRSSTKTSVPQPTAVATLCNCAADSGAATRCLRQNADGSGCSSLGNSAEPKGNNGYKATTQPNEIRLGMGNPQFLGKDKNGDYREPQNLCVCVEFCFGGVATLVIFFLDNKRISESFI